MFCCYSTQKITNQDILDISAHEKILVNNDWSKCKSMDLIISSAKEYAKIEDFTTIAKNTYANMGKLCCTKKLYKNPLTLFILLDTHNNTIESFINTLYDFHCICELECKSESTT